VLQQSDWRTWLDYSAPAGELIRTLPGGSLEVRAAPR
jgi:putative SOS response-associated peptidase YedK